MPHLLYSWCLFFAILWTCHPTHAGIYLSNPKVLQDVDIIELGHTNIADRLHASFSSRSKRSSPNLKTDDLRYTMFILGNATTHNQALIHWSGDNSKVVFILTRRKSTSPQGSVSESTLWRSDDYGSHYSVQTKKFDRNTTLKSYYVCPTNKNKVIFVDMFNKSQRIWVSRDEGVNYDSFNVPFSIDKIEFHPDQDDWLLGYDKSTQKLYASMDLGSTWTKMQDDVSLDRYYWYVKGVDKGENANKVVHIEYRDMDFNPSPVYFIRSCLIPDCVTPSPLQKHAKDLGRIDKYSLVVQDSYVVAQKPGARAKLYVSYLRKGFVKAQFAFNNPQTDYHLISSDNNCIVIGVNHKNNVTLLFFSDETGHKFVQSKMPNVRYFEKKVGSTKVFTVDMHEVAGLLGVYIANVVSSNGQANTMITRDYGRQWSYITNVDKKTNCIDNCKLNLHLAMELTKGGYYVPSIVSKKTVPGLIVAHGTWGQALTDHPVTVNVYVSEDGGYTWRESLNQRHLIVMADHGSILVCIRMIFLQPVSKLQFSNDAGKTWSELTFSKEQINVDGILTEPGEHTYYLTLFGHRTYRDSWRVYQLDMQSVFSRNCSYPSDFHNITTLGGNQSTTPCELGMSQTVEALKTGRSCIVGMDYKRKSNIIQCACQEWDFECDLGYINFNGGSCTSQSRGPIDSVPGDAVYIDPEPCINGKRNVSTGIRKKPGNNCTDGIEHDKTFEHYKTEDCSPTPTQPLEFQVEIHNSSHRAVIGDTLFFSVQGADSSSPASFVEWYIMKADQDGQKDNLYKKRSPNLPFKPSKPGLYEVRAESSSHKSDAIIVEFWYPIKTVKVYMPPVVATNRVYNATATIETIQNIRSDYKLLGPVKYQWLAAGNIKEVFVSQSNKLTNIKYSAEGQFNIKVTADNDVSYQSANEKVAVKKFVQEIVIETSHTPQLDNNTLNNNWIQSFKEIFLSEMWKVKEISDLFNSSKGMVKDDNLHVFVGPELPLQISLYLSPVRSTDEEKNLLEAAEVMQHYIMEKISTFSLHMYDITITGSFIINGEGEYMPYTSGGTNAAVVAIAIIIVIVVVVCIAIIFRRYITSLRLADYFRVRNVAGMSHIVRNQNNDLSPIVGNESEFMDEELDTMESIGTDQATLEFHG